MARRESLLVAGAVFVLYALGACRTIYVGDSGELVAAVHLLGIPHPTGYPLYVLLGKIWTLLVPVGSVAFRMSLFSAACAAAACGVLHALARRLGLHPVAALTGALLLAVAPSYWGESNVQRVYALNALFVALATSAAFSWSRSRRSRDLALTALLCGLGACNHTFMGFFGIAVGSWALACEPALLRQPRALASALGAGLAGLLPYAYLPLRSRMDPPLDWGNPESWDGFLAVLTRREYWDRRYLERPSDLLVIGADYLRGLGAELLWIGAALAAVGLAVGFRRRWPVGLPVLVMAVNLAVMAGHGSRTDLFVWHRYYVPSYVMAALLVALGTEALLERLPRTLRLVPLLLPLGGLLVGYREFDRSRYRIAEDFSRTLLDGLPPGAHLAASDDNILFVLIYLHWVEGVRPDVDLIMQGAGGELPPLRFDPERDPLFLTHFPNWSASAIEAVPAGLVFQAVRRGSRPRLHPVKERLDGEDDPRVPQDYLTRNLVGHFHYMRASSLEATDWAAAHREYLESARRSPDNDVLFFNLGLIYRRNGLYPESLAFFERAHRINPRPIVGHERARALEQVEEARRLVAEAQRVEQAVAPEVREAAGTPAWHRRIADVLRARGEALLALGHERRALM